MVQPPPTHLQNIGSWTNYFAYDYSSVMMNSGAKIPLGIENVQFFPPNPWQMMISLNPLDALMPKMPYSFFANIWVRVTSGARG